jgi:glycosyltransferase involved in cell wall biosynthesis
MFEYSTFFLLASWKLIRLHLKRKYDVVEVANLPDFLVFTSVIPKLLGAKVSLYFMELMPEVFADKLKTGPNHIAVKLLRFVEKVSAKWADHVIAANGICQQEILKSRGVPASKMSAVLNVPDEKVFSQRSSNGSDPGRFCITTHSTLLERYGIQVLLRAVPLLTGEIPQLEVMVLGDGEYRHQLEEMAKTLGIADRVRFTGFVPIEELLSVLTRADVGIVSLLPQKQPQMPNKLFEYLALGKPTVATALPAVKPYVNSDSVMYYEPENERDLARCILELYRNPEKRKEQAANGLAAYQKYRWSAMKYEYLKVFDQLTKQHDRIVL